VNPKPIAVCLARPEDGASILSMLHELAAWEGAPHPPRLCQSTLERDVFAAGPKLHILVAKNPSGDNVGFLSYHENYSSWEGASGIHIGDLWVSPAWRNQGAGAALLRQVIDANQHRRIDVFVIEDNDARFFYERLGFKEQTQWKLYRVEPDS
jgi:ribosomal protein S18 acetylase RimI-like enzyme